MTTHTIQGKINRRTGDFTDMLMLYAAVFRKAKIPFEKDYVADEFVALTFTIAGISFRLLIIDRELILFEDEMSDRDKYALNIIDTPEYVIAVEEERGHPARKILQLSHQTTGIPLKTLRTIMRYLVDVVGGALPIEGENFFESDFFIEEDVEMEALFSPYVRDKSLHCRLSHILLQS